jgi:hypothetical protein
LTGMSRVTITQGMRDLISWKQLQREFKKQP